MFRVLGLRVVGVKFFGALGVKGLESLASGVGLAENDRQRVKGGTLHKDPWVCNLYVPIISPVKE